jgi:predicted CXXCH cytochrome family protein
VRRILLPLLVIGLFAPSAARPAGGHGTIGCVACHGLKKAEGTSSFCLKCHATKDQGGRDILPIDGHVSHPFGITSVNPRRAKVPAELLRQDGRFDCLSCHDPHPSNANFMYLRVDTGAKGREMERFCAVCHPAKSGEPPGKLTATQPRR